MTTTMKMTLGRKVTKTTMRRKWKSQRKSLEGDKASEARWDFPRSLPHERPSPGDEGNVVDVDGHFAVVRDVVVDEAGDDGGDGDAAIRLPPRCP